MMPLQRLPKKIKPALPPEVPTDPVERLLYFAHEVMRTPCEEGKIRAMIAIPEDVIAMITELKELREKL